jgi:predicted Zn-dependent peptidase
MPRGTLTGYMQRNYSAGNVIVAATGKLRHEEILDLVQKHFGDLPGEMPPPVVPSRYAGGEFREDRDLDQVHLLLGFPSVAYGDPDYYASILLSTLLGGGMSSRLFQEIREKRGLVYSIYSFTSPFKDGGLFGIYAGTGESEAAELMPVMLDELTKVQAGVTAAEVNRARAQLKSSLLMSMESTGSRCEQLARQWQTFGRTIPMEESLAKINAVTEADIKRAAVRHFRSSPTLATIGPSAQVPSLAEIAVTLAA